MMSIVKRIISTSKTEALGCRSIRLSARYSGSGGKIINELLTN